MRFLIELGRKVHWWVFGVPTNAEYLEEYCVECTLCGHVQLDEVCVECNCKAWVEANPGFND